MLSEWVMQLVIRRETLLILSYRCPGSDFVFVDCTSTELRNLLPQAVGTITTLPTASQHKSMTYTNCCLYRVVPLDDEQ
jgi:hypothetical protein